MHLNDLTSMSIRDRVTMWPTRGYVPLCKECSSLVRKQTCPEASWSFDRSCQ